MKYATDLKSVTVKMTHKEFCALYDAASMAGALDLGNPEWKSRLSSVIGVLFKIQTEIGFPKRKLGFPKRKLLDK